MIQIVAPPGSRYAKRIRSPNCNFVIGGGVGAIDVAPVASEMARHILDRVSGRAR